MKDLFLKLYNSQDPKQVFSLREKDVKGLSGALSQESKIGFEVEEVLKAFCLATYNSSNQEEAFASFLANLTSSLLKEIEGELVIKFNDYLSRTYPDSLTLLGSRFSEKGLEDFKKQNPKLLKELEFLFSEEVS